MADFTKRCSPASRAWDDVVERAVTVGPLGMVFLLRFREAYARTGVSDHWRWSRDCAWLRRTGPVPILFRGLIRWLAGRAGPASDEFCVAPDRDKARQGRCGEALKDTASWLTRVSWISPRQARMFNRRAKSMPPQLPPSSHGRGIAAIRGTSTTRPDALPQPACQKLQLVS